MPVPNPEQNMSEIWDLFNYANVVTGNHTTNATTNELITAPQTHYFGDFMVVIVWIILFSVFNNQFITNRAMKALMVSSFMTFIWATLLDVVGLVDQIVVVLPIGLLGIAVVVDKLAKDE